MAPMNDSTSMANVQFKSLSLEDEPAGDEDTELDTCSPSLGPRYSSTLSATEYDHLDPELDRQTWASAPTPHISRRAKRQSQGRITLDAVADFEYVKVADVESFRLCVIQPGTGVQPIQCQLIWESVARPSHDYVCLSYCWETTVRDRHILVDGSRLAVTANLSLALQNLRRPTTTALFWIDQICINQDDKLERSRQVSIMHRIFSQAKEVRVWLGESDARLDKLCEYARRMRRGEDNPRHVLHRILSARQVRDALQRLLQRPWFTRVWVLPEVALANFTTIAIGRSSLSWDNLVRLVRDTFVQSVDGFDKGTCLPGNARQKIAILAYMSHNHRQGTSVPDIARLLILAKGSRATDSRDYIYAFHGVMSLTTVPDYDCAIEHLYISTASDHVKNLLERRTTFGRDGYGIEEPFDPIQLMSILYGAGRLHQHLDLPSWVPDWSFAWHLAPMWCRTISDIFITSSKASDGEPQTKHVWLSEVQDVFRAGGEKVKTFDLLEDEQSLRISAYVFDMIERVHTTEETTRPRSVTERSSSDAMRLPARDRMEEIPIVYRYGRVSFATASGLLGVATHGIHAGDALAILPGGDVPVVMRRVNLPSVRPHRAFSYHLLCECHVDDWDIMDGTRLRQSEESIKEVILM